MEFYAMLKQRNDRKFLRNLILRVHSQVLSSLHLTFIDLVLIHQKFHLNASSMIRAILFKYLFITGSREYVQ
jgi:hypothetical protein